VIYNLLSILAVLGYGWVCYFWVVNFAIPMAREITNLSDIVEWWKYPKAEDQKTVFHKQRRKSEREVEKIIKKLYGK
tara:strand:+ start:137 stop:367 length:231 start_codon:yes stop_codon:yes gene_type:complete